MGQLSSFDQLMLPHLDAAYNLAFWLARSESDAEDWYTRIKDKGAVLLGVHARLVGADAVQMMLSIGSVAPVMTVEWD